MNRCKTLKEIVDLGKKLLQDNAIESSDLDAEIFASEAFKVSKIEIITKGNISLSEFSTEQIVTFQKYIDLRISRKSVSEILQKKEFYGFEFHITNDVLTPRPETEILIENFIEHLKKYVSEKNALHFANQKLKIIDIGTGSGCIAITIALLLKNNTFFQEKIGNNFEIIACDISEKALLIAQKNITKHNVKNFVTIQKSDLLENIDKNFIKKSFIITNLPYIPETDSIIMSKEVLQGDPKIALFSGKTGTDLYKKLFENLFQKKSNFYEINACFFEFDSGVVSAENITGQNVQKKYYEFLLCKCLQSVHHNISFFTDYSNQERFGKVLF